MNAIIKQMARACYEADEDGPWSGLSESCRASWCESVRAALAAIPITEEARRAVAKAMSDLAANLETMPSWEQLAEVSISAFLTGIQKEK